MQRFSCETHQDGSLTIVRAIGELDLAAADGLREQLRSQIAPGAHVIVDCEQLTFCDSMGLRVLAQGRHDAEQLGARFALVAVPAALLRVLELAGMAGVFTVFKDMSEAKADRGSALEAVAVNTDPDVAIS